MFNFIFLWSPHHFRCRCWSENKEKIEDFQEQQLRSVRIVFKLFSSTSTSDASHCLKKQSVKTTVYFAVDARNNL
jgi:hypothetical protein